MCLTLSPLSFYDNKVLKMLIGYANIYSSVQDYRQKKLYVFDSSIGSGRTNESNGIYKKEACVARMKTESEDKERLETIRSCLPEVDVIRESKEPSEAEVHQSLKTGS